ncbi:MAG: D-alanyl-D-alanine carboxypeptidase [Gammaproteobacteria bacterium]|uniref:D-alanyl-D-alanine carboxypeptidase family protein n=1 Tax=Rhodoferax sp. TaxID=50421 RepID=UPI0017C1A3C1|nr:D-alanyl-D-alanine carboxypeptidase family protein [Rhodoferax sp.]MBU3900701.1 D-alanyl-D-alanine carboxypeptidase [Gammaproteobacteria bacterium]MBA3059666.1 D-alanyl-D-alanine carboxypeptidase [Rhodoferax sp.]MBU3998373.1 D-alanyl-D-alanine carboxypeptidase [Gammaproteobacteria bacterium]MBU4081359.1 D-alanyl-D-alanine carboxypeptidase [Gammaproteobacteria bacterium]MBU4112328.1 D-alanyl-D-alanine carboxypeptidase [Gammaproteobacteria bacterium]
MKKLLLTLAAAVCFSVAAQTPQPPEIAARSYLLFDVTANQFLAERDIDSPVEQASLTKLMTAYVVFDALRSKKIDLKQTLPVSERAWKMPGSRMFIDPKMQVPVEDLLKGMIVQSGNDATMALAEGVGGTAEQFVRLMNEQAKALGMKSTNYRNPEGLTEAGHTTTARDLSILANRLMHDFPDYVGYYAIKKYRYPGTPAANDNNRNLLLFRDPTVDGLKTGHTNAAGYCLIATAKREVVGLGASGVAAGSPAAMGSRRLLAIVLGAASENARANEAQKLLNWGYTAFEPVKLFDGNQAVVSPAVWKGKTTTVKLGRPEAIVVAVPAGTAGKLKTQVLRSDPLVAPFTKGQQVGTLKVTSGEQVVVEVPLLVLETVEQAGVLGRAWDALRLWIK